jgi:hypothetical protein
MSQDNKTRYFTKDTLLATWLYMNGVNYEGITQGDPAQLIFNDHSDIIDHLIKEFQTGNPHGNIISFFQSYKYLLSQIKER